MLLVFKSIKIAKDPDDEKNHNNSESAKRRNPSRVRDHLANERTYLAWMRTAISLMGFGVVIVRYR